MRTLIKNKEINLPKSPHIKHPVANIFIQFKVPELKKFILTSIRNALKDYEEEWIPVEKWFEYRKATNPDFDTPGYRIRGYRVREDLTQQKLADKLGIKKQNLSAMEHNRRPIGKAMAKRIGQILNVPYQKFL